MQNIDRCVGVVTSTNNGVLLVIFKQLKMEDLGLHAVFLLLAAACALACRSMSWSSIALGDSRFPLNGRGYAKKKKVGYYKRQSPPPARGGGGLSTRQERAALGYLERGRA